MKNFSGVCQAAGADKPLRAFFIWITNIVTLLVWDVFPEHEQLIIPAPVALLFFRNSRTVMILVPELHDMETATLLLRYDKPGHPLLINLPVGSRGHSGMFPEEGPETGGIRKSKRHGYVFHGFVGVAQFADNLPHRVFIHPL